jgi:hypothetical protein
VYSRELKKVHDIKSGQAAGTARESKWQYSTTMSFVNAVMIPRPTSSNVPAVEELACGSSASFDGQNTSTNASINGTENDEFSESVSKECRPKKYLGTKIKMNFQEEALDLGKKKIRIMEERLRKKSQADEDEDCMFLISFLPSIKKLDDIQRLQLHMDFLSSVTRRLKVSKTLLLPVNRVPTASHISCPTSP